MDTYVLGPMLILSPLPVLLVMTSVYPFYAIRRFVILSRFGEGDRAALLRRRWRWFWPRTMLATFLLFMAAVVFPSVLPRLRDFLEKGGLVVFVPWILVNILTLSIFTDERALRRYERHLMEKKGS